MIELVVFFAVLNFASLGVRLVQPLLPGPSGLVIGLIAGLAVFPILVLIYDGWKGGLPALPRCRSGRCGALAYLPERLDDRFVLKCGCGGHYLRVGRRFFLFVNGTLTSYMRWRAFRGWVDDKDEAVPISQVKQSSDAGVNARLTFLSRYSNCRLLLFEMPVGSVQAALKLFYAPLDFLAWAWPTKAAWVGVLLLGIAWLIGW